MFPKITTNDIDTFGAQYKVRVTQLAAHMHC
jgi:hypothetical protein